MKSKFKPLGLVAAVAAATAGYAGVTTAQVDVAANGLGGVGLIPYYTVRENFVTGVHVTNTSDQTQVVKVRLRRGIDSMDALDFNVIMSPKDVWTGFIQQEGDNIVFNTTDTSCTAPAAQNGKFVMPSVYRQGAEEGYIEVIAMGAPTTESAPIALAAKHNSAGVPLDCAGVRSNFFAFGKAPNGSDRGVETNALSHQVSSVLGAGGTPRTDLNGPTTYVAPGNPLQVSYFLRDAAGGLEMGNQAVMLENFLALPSITNQQFGLFSGDLLGFDYPDLNGGVPNVEREKFVELRAAIGSETVINDWSANADLNVGTDWVITFPGQYTMLNLPHYFAAQAPGSTIPCNRVTQVPFNIGTLPPAEALQQGPCDFRDIPATASFDVYDREEQQVSGPDGELVVSPQVPGVRPTTQLPYEVNVVQWGPEPVLHSENSDIVVQVPDSPFGWAELSVTSADANLAVCDATPASGGKNIANPADFAAAVQAYACDSTGVVANQIPKIGFVAWERSFPGNPDANYGRAINHAYGSDS